MGSVNKLSDIILTNPINIFKVGDRVECCGEMSGLNLNGQTGEIIKIYSDIYRVYFDDKFVGGLHSDDNMCWDVFANNIKYVIGANHEEEEEENKWWID